jgi:hypothetical protein
VITAGYYIGQVLDDLAAIGNQVENRNRVGLFEMTKLLENFYRDVLNEIYGYSLKNTNEDRSNSPAVDLVDDSKGIAIQVTSSGTSAKINKTLETLTDDQLSSYTTIIILVAGKKQKSFTLDADKMARTKFRTENVWDYTDLCRSLVNLQLDRLQALHKIVTKQIARVKIELEIPALDGTYATGIEQFAEAIPRERLSDLKKFTASVHNETGATDVEVREFIETFVSGLKELPRITREIFEYMWTRREKTLHRGASSERFKVSHTKLERLLERYRDLDGDLRLLNDAGLITTYEPHETADNSFFHVLREGTASGMLHSCGLQLISDFITKNDIPSKKVFVSLDFGDF